MYKSTKKKVFYLFVVFLVCILVVYFSNIIFYLLLFILVYSAWDLNISYYLPCFGEVMKTINIYFIKYNVNTTINNISSNCITYNLVIFPTTQ